MFGELLKRLLTDQPAKLPDADARLALSALMVRIARSDGDYAVVEQETIERLIRQRFGLQNVEAGDLRKEAEQFEEAAPDTVRFTRAIKEAVSHEDRIAVIESLWELALADGERDEQEDSLLRLVAPLLGINDRDSALARQRVEQRID